MYYKLKTIRTRNQTMIWRTFRREPCTDHVLQTQQDPHEKPDYDLKERSKRTLYWSCTTNPARSAREAKRWSEGAFENNLVLIMYYKLKTIRTKSQTMILMSFRRESCTDRALQTQNDPQEKPNDDLRELSKIILYWSCTTNSSRSAREARWWSEGAFENNLVLIMYYKPNTIRTRSQTMIWVSFRRESCTDHALHTQHDPQEKPDDDLSELSERILHWSCTTNATRSAREARRWSEGAFEKNVVLIMYYKLNTIRKWSQTLIWTSFGR